MRTFNVVLAIVLALMPPVTLAASVHVTFATSFDASEPVPIRYALGRFLFEFSPSGGPIDIVYQHEDGWKERRQLSASF